MRFQSYPFGGQYHTDRGTDRNPTGDKFIAHLQGSFRTHNGLWKVDSGVGATITHLPGPILGGEGRVRHKGDGRASIIFTSSTNKSPEAIAEALFDMRKTCLEIFPELPRNSETKSEVEAK